MTSEAKDSPLNAIISHIDIDEKWLHQIEQLTKLDNSPLTPAHNQVLVLNYILSMEQGFYDNTNIDAQIADTVAANITQNADFKTPLSGSLYIPYVKMLNAETYLLFMSQYQALNSSQDLGERVEVANRFIQSQGMEYRDEMQEYLDSWEFQTLAYKYVELITPLIDIGKIESHFDGLDDIPLNIAADKTELSKSRIDRLATHGRIHSIKPGGYILFVSLSDINNYLENRVRGGVGIKVPAVFIAGDTEYYLATIASEQFGITTEWISILIKRGKVKGTQPEEYRGRWYVNLNSLQEYLKR